MTVSVMSDRKFNVLGLGKVKVNDKDECTMSSTKMFLSPK